MSNGRRIRERTAKSSRRLEVRRHGYHKRICSCRDDFGASADLPGDSGVNRIQFKAARHRDLVQRQRGPRLVLLRPQFVRPPSRRMVE